MIAGRSYRNEQVNNQLLTTYQVDLVLETHVRLDMFLRKAAAGIEPTTQHLPSLGNPTVADENKSF